MLWDIDLGRTFAEIRLFQGAFNHLTNILKTR